MTQVAMTQHAAREPMVYVAVGMKGIGKTYQSELLINQYVKGNAAVGFKPRKVLIFDVNNEYRQYKEMACDSNTILQFVKQNVVEVRRVSSKRSDGKIKSDTDFQEDLRVILENFVGGCVVLEDLSLFVGDAMSNKLVGRLSTNRHRDMDIITHFQSIAKAGHPKWKPLYNVLRLHKTGDSVRRVAKKFGDDYAKVRIAEIIVNNRYDTGVQKTMEMREKGVPTSSPTYMFFENEYRRFFLHVNFDKHSISGKFTREEFDAACKTYLDEECDKEMRHAASILQRDGVAKTQKAAFQVAFGKKMKELSIYYGNKK